MAFLELIELFNFIKKPNNMKYNLPSFSKFILVLFVPFFFFSCHTNNTSKNSSSNEWNTGTITIATDENLENIAPQLAQIYENDNPAAHIIFNYQPQDKIIADFISGKITSMFISRALTKEEIAYSSQQQKTATVQNIIGYNAIAVIANHGFKDSIFYLKNITNYLQANSSIKLVFDNNQSGIPKNIMQQTNLKPADFKNALVVKNAQEVIEYVQRNTASIGFIPFNLISNHFDSSATKILTNIKLLAVNHNDTIQQISQESIYQQKYVLEQCLNIVLGRNPELVGTGFTNFLTRERAAKILFRAGLVPAVMPNRNMIIREEILPK